MNFIEFTTRQGNRYLHDIDSGWEVYDNGDGNYAHWVNNTEGRNMDCSDSYEMVKKKLLTSQQASLLNTYAGLAMQGRLASVGFEQAFNCGHEDYAQWSVGMAKALIAELNKQSVKES